MLYNCYKCYITVICPSLMDSNESGDYTIYNRLCFEKVRFMIIITKSN